DKWARRGVCFLVIGLGAFFAYFNESYGWIAQPEYFRLSDLWFNPVEPYIRLYLPGIVVALGVIFLGASCYSFHRFAKADAAGGSAA
ncbi:hypothetical protein, partial [Lysobacter sp. A3-1-A15]|uniref:hypothetical protein n=1 Tax=Novilysobacter viscosus TaxID=3098602 RepID=UPI002ED85061